MRTALFALALLGLPGCDLLFPPDLLDGDRDGFTEDLDCDEADATVNPGAEELCDGIDNDCDGQIDEAGASGADAWYPDADGDDFGDPALPTSGCAAPVGYVSGEAGLDCDDGDASIHPGADETCNGLDDDCDGEADEEAADATVWYQDADGDGYGTEDVQVLRCEEPSGFVDVAGDCDDAWPEVRPGGTETCNGLDDDCDGETDEDDALDAHTWFLDADGDGWGVSDSTTMACWQPSAYSSRDRDCDDADPGVHPDAEETCDEVDEDCDGATDEQALDAPAWFVDADGDGYGDVRTILFACTLPAGYSADSTDCDDASAAVNPGATEVCDPAGADEDCDGLVDDLDDSVSTATFGTWWRDDDGDGYGGSVRAVARCDAPAGYVAAALGEDCAEGDARVHPGATEICDTTETDDDCDGLVNGDDPGVDPATLVTWYRDADQDGFGAHATATDACDAPTGYVADDTDCDDGDASISPSGAEVCDAADVDEDCDGVTDDWDGSVDPASRGTWYADGDGDGFGDPGAATGSCDAPAGFTADDTDCDDADADVHPDAEEVCDAADVDEDCDGRADDLDRSVRASSKTAWYADDDGDGYGDPGDGEQACDAPPGFVADGTDCDDDRASVNPGEAEICDSDDRDEDCDGQADDADRSVSSATMSTFYADDDDDGYGDLSTPTAACDAPTGYVADYTDCDDAVSTTFPGATEVCNYTDDDCDGGTDEGVTVTYWQDVDRDGEGGAVTSGLFCEPTPAAGWSAARTDCDDADPWVYTGAPELCDGQRNDCSGSSWRTSDEDETVSLESTSGAWSDLTDAWDDGTPMVAATVTLPGSGTVHICPANWYVRLNAPAGADVALVGRYGYADTALNGASSGSVVTLADATVTVSITDLTIEEGLAQLGAGVRSNGGDLTVSDCLLRYNYLSSSAAAQGAAIYASGGSVLVTGTTFRANGVLSATLSYGGAIFASNAEVAVSGSSFENNAARWGGAVSWSASGASGLTIEASTFDGNEAETGDGGGVYVSSSGSGAVEITDCAFTDDQADGDGGGLYFSATGSAPVTVRDSTFEYCIADSEGGGLYLGGAGTGTRLLDTLALTGCEADTGGGIYTAGDLTVMDTGVATCAAAEGGGIAAENGAFLALDTVEVSGNEAETLGAGLLLRGADLLASACIIDSNQVPASAAACYGGDPDAPRCAGAGIYASDADVLLDDTLVSANEQLTSQDTFGGGIYLTDGELTLSGATEVSDNVAEYGAGVLAWGDAVATSVSMDGGAQITSNDGPYYAGLYLDTATFSCSGSATADTGITAHLTGGGIYLHYEHGPATLADVFACDFGATGLPDDNFASSTAGRDLYLAGVGWYSWGDNAAFTCSETGCS